MVKIKYDKGGCVGCPKEWGCLGAGCPYCWETILICDKCGEQGDELICLEDETGYHLCEDCFEKSIVRITYDNARDFVKEY